ncbi:hypothetical protein SESBI_00219 [Sesbania bispinosa]|nr:hypothetical protein SESBI_00219 [Sesbania bispinosa]
MEKGPSPPPKPDNNLNHRETLDDLDDDDDLYEKFKNGSNTRSLDKLYRNGLGGGGGVGFRIRIPTGVSVAQPGSKLFGNQKLNNNPNDSGSRGYTMVAVVVQPGL